MTILQINADIKDWVRDYKGAKFHAILCDPPYHLTSITKRFGKKDAKPAKYGKDGAFQRASRGFMGTTWDGGGIAFDSDVWHSLGELLFPGAFMFVYAGTRTYHRVAVAVEDAGFIIHPAVGWITCLSADTEILTDEGWKTYDQLSVGSNVMCYNVKDKTFGYMPTKEVVNYEYDDTAYNIKSDTTDQIVTRTHRVIVERNGKQVFREAETLERQENVPILAGVLQVWGVLSDKEYQRILQENNLRFGGMQKESFSKTPVAQAQRGDDDVSCMWEAVLPLPFQVGQDIIPDMLTTMQRGVEGKRVIEAIQNRRDYLQASQSERETKAKGKMDGGKEPIMEGRNNVFSKARKLCADKIHSLSSRVFGNGTQGRIRNGTSLVSGAVIGTSFERVGGGSPHKSQSSRQSFGEPNVVFQQHGTQEIRELWTPATTLASVNPIHYKGKVWCVRVPTGAFVARRKGQVFITGNSQGFPKATRIDTQIDRREGVERAKVGEAKTGVASGTHKHTGIENSWGYNDGYYETVPTTPMAKSWSHHRYGLMVLKPSFEFILCAQRPYDGKPLDNIIENGAGGLNIDGARVGSGDNGRWPANVVLSHSEECKKIGTRQESYPINRFTDGAKPFGHGAGHEFETEMQTIEVDVYDCVEGCPVKNLDIQSHKWNKSREITQVFYTVPPLESEPVMYVPKVSPKERHAGLSDPNIHPTLKPIELNKWLATLLLPPNEYAPRRILNPFAGVLSEAIGAELAGWEEVVAVELTPEYIPTGKARAEYWTGMRSSGTDARKLGTAQLSFDEEIEKTYDQQEE